jgi:hypothetical protein
MRPRASTTLADFLDERDSQISFSVTHGWSAFGGADPFASVSNTLCAPNNPKAKTVTFGFAPAGIDAETKSKNGARSLAVTDLMSFLKIMAVHPSIARGEIAKSAGH